MTEGHPDLINNTQIKIENVEHTQGNLLNANKVKLMILCSIGN